MSAHPFRFSLDTPLGPLRVEVLPGRAAEVVPDVPPGPRPGFPLELDGARFALRARVVRGRRGWRLRDVEVLREGAGPSAVRVALALMPALAPALEREARRFVERDLVGVLAERRGDEAEISRVRAEIERRRDKLRRLARAASRAEPGRSAREAALRAELAGLAAPAPAAA